MEGAEYVGGLSCSTVEGASCCCRLILLRMKSTVGGYHIVQVEMLIIPVYELINLVYRDKPNLSK